MATWPNIAGPSTLTERSRKKQHKSDFEAGYVQSRPQWTRTRRDFDLGWNALYKDDKITLEAFFDENQGNTFDWTHPDGTTYTVRFADDSIEFEHKAGPYWTASVVLEEA